LNKWDKNKHSVWFLILEKIELSPFSIMLTIVLLHIAFIKWKCDCHDPNCFRIYHEEMLNFVKGIFCLIKLLCYFCPLFSLCAILFLLIYYFELTSVCSVKPKMAFDVFYILLNSVCKDFIKNILICVHQWIWCLIFFFYPVCIWVVYQNNSDFIEYV
jgi:hypothetical protein